MKKILVSVMIIALVVGITGAGFAAVFDDSETSSSNAFASGTLDISLGTASYSANIGNMQPGDTETVTLDVKNDGSLPLNYTISTALSGPITGGTTPPYVSARRVDTHAYAPPETLSVVGGGDASDTVEVDIKLPMAAGNNYQGLDGNLAITFDAVQQ